MKKKPLIILTGPTAVGKTKASIGLAKAVDGEIISADSMQVYRHMDIGSAKIKPEEMEGIPHHLIDVLEPDDEFHVVKFQELAKKAMREIWERGHIPIVTGGTGFYIQALLYDIDFDENEKEDACRKELEAYAREHGAEALHEKLALVDPASAEMIHPNNIKRVIRALEFYEQTGKRISEHNETQRQRESPYAFAYFVLTDDRAHLYERINRRVDQMIEEGLVNEVQALKDKGYTKQLVSMQGLGYKEILDYLDGNCTLEEAIYTIKRDTRHFAKRQLTWFKRERDVIWINKQSFGYEAEQILDEMLSKLPWKAEKK
ncbi:tRNA (adenosine(37)-N6)-dimethylallyltransferase MiaA [Dorea sp. AF24-7LB]|uniref:tRNA (adenosine(37)-N6)-dimethylallyltransferase MiaA n=1 Tax=Dorea sp. AF24-7LB TaxID=2293097 RepID=UPI000E4FBF3B|nr:tRNA (adenosine(37)-N6)-dimethylallyltransferase MiaA [Dorea sp. AF24-7LB]RHQ57803.1 tRNA (adenosine(37)-N6)-dimethylallyltransferase MiaA [Dorea sp. AF24-7LB]